MAKHTRGRVGNPTQFLRKQQREADPNHQIRQDYKRLAKAMRLRLKDWPLKIRRSKVKPHTTGRCYAGWNTRIVLTIGAEADRASICSVLLHELAHARASIGHYREGHTDRWRSLYCDGLAAAYGVNLSTACESSGELTCEIADAIREVLEGEGNG